MFKYIQKRFALSEKGAKDFTKGVAGTTLLNISLMATAVYLLNFLNEYLVRVFNPGRGFVSGFSYYLLLAIAFITAIFLIALIQYKSTFISVYQESADRRVSLAEKLRRLPLAFFGEKNLSDLTSTIMDDATQLEHTFSHAVPQAFASIFSLLFFSIGLFIYNWKLSLSLFWVVPVAGIVIAFSKGLQHRCFKTGYRAKREVSESIQEGLETIQEIKSYNRESHYLKDLNKTLDSYEKNLIHSELLVGVSLNIAKGILQMGFATVIITGATLYTRGEISLFTYLAFLLVSSRIYIPVSTVFNNLAALFYLDVRIDRMNEMQSLPVQSGVEDFNPTEFDIQFKDIHFSYEEERKVLNGISFTAKQGEITAIVGPSGGGKSTTAKLAARFWDITQGEILLGGVNIGTVDPEKLLEYYSVVFQDVVLFNSSVMDNIRIGKLDATDEEVIRVAKLAQCDHFIEKLPKGYNTLIGENGESLSGGERQRISIARALLKDAPIVLLDEATASLDVENETKIQKAISQLVKDKTVLIIAHRMRTIANSDKIVVLNSGFIDEKGTHEELLSKGGTYSNMWNAQNREIIEGVI